MGIFRHSSTTAPTDTIPARTTLSARTRISRRATLTTASVITCAGVFCVAAVNAGPGPSATTHVTQSASRGLVQLNVDEQSNASTPSKADTSSEQAQTTTTVNTSATGDNVLASVTINGQPVAVPQNGSVNKTIVDGNDVTSLEVNSSSEGSSFNSTFTSLNVNVNSSTTSFDDGSP